MRRSLAFSLIEVLCAILILGIGLVGLTQGITSALSSSKETELQTVAALLAAARLETLRAEAYLVPGTTEGEGEGDLSLYVWRQAITITATEGLFDVEVSVAHARSGQSLYELRTLLFDPPVYSSLDRGERRGDRDQIRQRERIGQ
jgi:prepilin-type N-terminal cleavage/methylation domain-containing protein